MPRPARDVLDLQADLAGDAVYDIAFQEHILPLVQSGAGWTGEAQHFMPLGQRPFHFPRSSLAFGGRGKIDPHETQNG